MSYGTGISHCRVVCAPRIVDRLGRLSVRALNADLSLAFEVLTLGRDGLVHAPGGLRLGAGGACGAGTAGTLRYGNVEGGDEKPRLEFCDGTEYKAVYSPPPPQTCNDLLTQGKSEGNGLYELQLEGSLQPYSTYCDMHVQGFAYLQNGVCINHSHGLASHSPRIAFVR